MHRPPADSYKNPQRLAIALQVLLGITAIVLVLDAAASLHRASVVDRILDGRVVTLEQADQSDHYVLLSSGSFLAAFIATGVVWLVWFHRSYKNVEAIGGRSLRFSSGWALGAWFVPLLNLVRPKQITDDLFGATAPPGAPHPVPRMLHVWWGLLVLSSFVARAASVSEGSGVRTMAAGDRWSALGDVVMIAAALLAIRLVRQLTARQIARHADRLVDLAPAGSAAPSDWVNAGPAYTAAPPPIAF